ncbi:DUF2577 family protein [Lysinibacillus sp. HST-98]|uniref:DUF2577 family protein n=1 Tax=Lysinibacillus sp. HST-98 TaxID=2800419 RepID=UPI00192846A9|nr:DUF2577 family protein [Lysinibacillus sp. HST-98]MBL3729278.1 DUF2577 family protein [Lysinibacillus sp. HST-98]
MDPITEFAKMIRERDNPTIVSMTTGTVISPLPNIVIKLNDIVTLDQSKLIVAEHIYLHYQYPGPTWLQSGDEVILMPTVDEQMYIMLDRVGESHVT